MDAGKVVDDDDADDIYVYIYVPNMCDMHVWRCTSRHVV